MTLTIQNMCKPSKNKINIERQLQRIKYFEIKRFNRYKYQGEKELKIFKEFHDNCIQINTPVEPIIMDDVNHDDFFESRQQEDL